MSSPNAAAPEAPRAATGVAFEQLDTLVRVTTTQSWAALATLFGLSVAAFLFAVFYWVPKKVTGEGILLIRKDRLSQVRSLGTGRLVKLEVGLGARVRVNQQIGWISQEDIKDNIRETESRLSLLKDENRRLTEFEDRERSTQEQAIIRLQQAIRKTVANSEAGLRVANRVVTGSERLRLSIQLSDPDYLKDLQQKHSLQNDLNGSLSKLAEIDLTWLTANNQRQRARLQRQLEIDRLETRRRLDLDKLDRTSRIVSHSEGTVTQVLTAPDEFVREGAPVVLLSSPREVVPGTDDSGDAHDYDAVVFVPAGEGKKVNARDFVEVMPATIKREEHGYIHGRVVAVSELPATRRAMDAALQHPDLVDAFMKKYAPGVLLRVHVRLEKRPNRQVTHDTDHETSARGNEFLWSTSSGAEEPLKTATMCEAAIIVNQQRLISLVLPWLRKLLGVK